MMAARRRIRAWAFFIEQAVYDDAMKTDIPRIPGAYRAMIDPAGGLDNVNRTRLSGAGGRNQPVDRAKPLERAVCHHQGAPLLSSSAPFDPETPSCWRGRRP